MLGVSPTEVRIFATWVRLQEDYFAQYAIDRVELPVKIARGRVQNASPVQ
jgi:hypothetical protein